MSYRQVIIKESEKLSLKNNQLLVTKDGNKTSVPLEDISFILIEDSKTVLTTRLLSEIGKYSIALIISDENYNPTSIMYPYNYHFRQLRNIEFQLKDNTDLHKHLWQIIIKKKIDNQNKVIENNIDNPELMDKLEQFRNEVELDDVTNREGLSAKMYFRGLFGKEFKRFDDDPINNALNYGYKIIVGTIIRELSVSGLNTYMGINHKSKTNNFNLAYDLIEPYRAIVDNFVYRNIDLLSKDLSFDIRQKLINLLNTKVEVNGRIYSLEYSTKILVKSYVKSIETGAVELDLPNFIYDK